MMFCLFLFAGFPQEGVSKDYFMYLYEYDLVRFGETRMEPTFTVFVNLIDSLKLNPKLIFLFYAAFGLSFKFLGISKLTKLVSLSLFVYVSNFFLLHEITQIRAGVASGVFLLSIPRLFNKQYFKYFMFVLLAIFFHYSSAIMLLLIFVPSNRLNNYVYILSIPVAFIIAYFGFGLGFLVEFLPFENLKKLVNIYKAAMEIGLADKINIFNPIIIMRILLFYSFLIFSKTLISENKYFIFLVNLYFVGILSFILLSDFPVLSFRVSEFLFVCEIILIPYLIFLFKPIKFGVIAPFAICMIFLLLNIYLNPLLLY